MCVEYHDTPSINIVMPECCALQVLIIKQSHESGRLTLSTKNLEPTPGDMIHNRQAVFDRADEMGKKYRDLRVAADRRAKALVRDQYLHLLMSC